MKRPWFLLAFWVSSCTETTEPGLTRCEAAKTIRSTPSFLTVAEEADIGARVLTGGFGGLYRKYVDTGLDTLVAFFTNTSIGETHKTDLRSLLLCNGVYPGWGDVIVPTAVGSIAIRQGQHTGTELLGYLRTLETLGSDPGVWGVGLDPETNRVWVGLTDASQLVRIQQQVSAASVPMDAVQLEVPPPTTGTEPFEVLNAPIQLDVTSALDLLRFNLRVRYTNYGSATRYPDWCVDLGAQFTAYFAYVLQKWDGSAWHGVKHTICDPVLLAPRAIGPGEAATDSVPVIATRRLKAEPAWQTSRTKGYYRFVGYVYRSLGPGPGGSQVVTDLAPLEERVSVPFRLISP